VIRRVTALLILLLSCNVNSDGRKCCGYVGRTRRHCKHIEITITSKLTVRSRKLIQKSRDSVFFNIEIPEF